VCLRRRLGLMHSFLGLLLVCVPRHKQKFFQYYLGKRRLRRALRNYHIHGLSLLCKQICTFVFVADFQPIIYGGKSRLSFNHLIRPNIHVLS
jgi:hypothetical protein